MSDKQKMTIEEATEFFSEFYHGEHHFPSKLKTAGYGWEMIMPYGSLSTVDLSNLTRLVLMAHHYAYRIEISPSGGIRRLSIMVHKRTCREGGISERHPTIEQAIAQTKFKNPQRF